MNDLPFNNDVFLVLYSLICLPKNSYFVLIHNKCTLGIDISDYTLWEILKIKIFSNKAELGRSFTLY